jgi:integral membrane protein (TIGR00529 family)
MNTLLLDVSATFWLLLTFLLIVLLMCSRLSLGHIFLIGTAVLAIFFKLPPESLVSSVWHSVYDPKTMALILTVSLIIVFSKAMEISGHMYRISQDIQSVLPNKRINLIFYPALIGLLPMPGGAVFSAPMVKEIGIGINLPLARMCFANYWFRHVWEYWWPTYPAVFLILHMTGLKLLPFALIMSPLSIFALCIGFWSLRDTKTISSDQNRPWSTLAIKQLSTEMLPIAIIIGIGLPSGPLLSMAFPTFKLSTELGLIVAIALAIFWIFNTNNLPKSKRITIWANPELIKTTYMIAALFVFKEVLQECHAVQAAGVELMNAGIPLVLVVITLPFMTGLATGLTIGFVGATFPIILSLVQESVLPSMMPAYLMLAVISGFVGVLVSPLHFCFTLSGKYFETPMLEISRPLRKTEGPAQTGVTFLLTRTGVVKEGRMGRIPGHGQLLRAPQDQIVLHIQPFVRLLEDLRFVFTHPVILPERVFGGGGHTAGDSEGVKGFEGIQAADAKKAVAKRFVHLARGPSVHVGHGIAQGPGESIIIKKARRIWIYRKTITVFGQPFLYLVKRLVVTYDIRR